MIIYKITNIINNKCYVGQTTQAIEERFAQHQKNKDRSALGKAIQKYGIENFTIEQIDTASSIEELNKKETEYISQYSSLSPNGYNLNTGGDSRKWSEESRKKLSTSHLGKKLSENHKSAIKESVRKQIQKDPDKFKKGAEIMQEIFRQNLKNGHHPKRGKQLSEESRKNISKSKRGSNNPMFGAKPNHKQNESLIRGRQARIESLPMVFCHQNGMIYKSVGEAAKAIGAARSSVSNVLIGFRKSCKGYTFEYVNRTHE